MKLLVSFIVFFIPFCIWEIKSEIRNAALYLIFCIAIFSVILPTACLYIKAFRLYIKKIPPIELTHQFYISNIENIQLSWNEIESIDTKTKSGAGAGFFLAIKVIDNSIIYNQTQNIIWKFLLWQNSSKKSGFLVLPFQLLKGNMYDIVNLINDYKKQKVSN